MRTIALRKMGVWAAAPLDEVVFDPTRYKETVRWTHICGCVCEGTARMVTLFARRGTTEIVIDRKTQQTDRDAVTWTGNMYLPGDYIIGMRAASVTGGEIMELSAFGVVEEPVTLGES